MASNTVLSDIHLLEAAKSEIHTGRFEAFELILKKYERLIYHVAAKYFGNREDAMDASQEAALKIYNGLKGVTLPENGNLKAWICTVTARACLDVLRKKRVPTVELEDEYFTTTESSAEDNALANLRANEILEAIDSLSKDHKMILILRDMQSLSYDEISEELGISIGTVKSRLSRARIALKDKLEEG